MISRSRNKHLLGNIEKRIYMVSDKSTIDPLLLLDSFGSALQDENGDNLYTINT